MVFKNMVLINEHRVRFFNRRLGNVWYPKQSEKEFTSLRLSLASKALQYQIGSNPLRPLNSEQEIQQIKKVANYTFSNLPFLFHEVGLDPYNDKDYPIHVCIVREDRRIILCGRISLSGLHCRLSCDQPALSQPQYMLQVIIGRYLINSVCTIRTKVPCEVMEILLLIELLNIEKMSVFGFTLYNPEHFIHLK